MERSDSLIKLVSLLVFAALVIYIGVSLYTRNTDPLRTVQATEMSLSDAVETTGMLVRYEQRVNASGSVTLAAEDGEKVAWGQTLARSYKGAESLARAEEIHRLTVEKEQLESLLGGEGGLASARDSVLELAAVVSSGDLSQLDAAAISVRATVMNQGGTDENAIRRELQETKDRLAQLSNESLSDTAIASPVAGVFSSVTDGFESVSPDDLTTALMPEELVALFDTPERTSGSFGKVVTGITWYYATVMDADVAGRLMGRSTITARFERTYSGTVIMTVVNIGPVSDGKCVVTLSSDRYMHEVASLREMTAQLVFSSLEGIRVPREAVHLDEEGQTFVYVLEGLQAQRVDVTILGQNDDGYLVEKTGSGIRLSDEIITKADGLSDGAVVVK